MKKKKTKKPISLPRYAKLVSEKTGAPPGTLVHMGTKRLETPRIRVIDFTETSFSEKTVSDINECFTRKDAATVRWIDVHGLHDTGIIAAIGAHYDLHPLLLEDVLTTGQRPKMEDHDKYIYLVLTMFSAAAEAAARHEQLSLILGERYLITFQEGETDIFEQVRERLRSSHAQIRKLGADYLAYCLLDAVVDNYFVVLEKFEESMELVEEAVLSGADAVSIHDLYNLKAQVLFMRRTIWPVRELVNQLQMLESGLISEKLDRFLKDLYDHILQVVETLDTYREIVMDIKESYLTGLSIRMNEVMKVLTIFTSIFIPLTFIAGVYGMNFKYMPELSWHWGYPALWVLMAGIAAGMLVFFRKKNWL